MKCQQILPYLPGHAGGDLRAETTDLVETHLESCETCRAEASRARRVVGGLALVAERDLEPPAFLLEAILERTVDAEPERSRMIPVLPVAAGDISRLVVEHKDAIASVGAATIVAAGAAYALWRAVRSSRSGQPATS